MRNLTEIEAFIKVVQLGGFLAAERATGIPKSTLSRKVMLLEKRLKTTLMKRTTRQLKLTEVGEQYFKGCLEALQGIDRLEESIVEDEKILNGVIRLTAPVEVASDILPPILSKFREIYPDVFFDLDLSDRIVDLIGESFDLALRAGGLTNSSSLIAKNVGHGAFKIYASPSYYRKINSTIHHPKDLKKWDCIYFDVDSGKKMWNLERKKNEKYSHEINPVIQSNSLLMIKNLVLSGNGLGLLPKFMCEKEVSAQQLISVLPDWSVEFGTFHVVLPRKKFTANKTKVFVDFLTKHLKERFQ